MPSLSAAAHVVEGRVVRDSRQHGYLAPKADCGMALPWEESSLGLDSSDIDRPTSAPRCDFSFLRNRSARQRACDISAGRLLNATSVNGRRAVVRPLQTVRSASDVDDKQTALCASPTARFADLGMSVSLPTLFNNGNVVDVARICAST